MKKTPQETIREILDRFSKDNYVYRGETKKHKKVATGLYRQYCQSDPSDSSKNPPIQNEHFFVSSVEKDVVEKAKQHVRPDALNIEVLTELQHFGGKTALLDFTKDIHIALFFACDGNFDQDGRIILFKTSGLTEKPDINYDHKDEAKHTLILPTGKSPRVIFQSSIFVHVPKGYLEEGKYEEIQIEKDIKKPLLDYLSKHFNIKTETIYNDIQGFIHNQHKHSTAEIEFYRGNAKAQEKKFDEAITNYDKAIELNPQLAVVYNNRGNAKVDLKNHEEAIRDYDKAIKLDSQSTEVYNNRGIAKAALGEHEEAIKDYDKAIKLDSQSTEAYNNRGIAKAALGEHEEAIRDYDKAIELDPQYAEAYNNRGVAKAALGEHEEAIRDYDKAIELNPKYAETYYNRGNSKAALGEHKEAIRDYDKAIEVNPKHAGAYNNRGNEKSALDEHKEAIRDYDKAIELNPKDAEAYNNRGNAKSALDEYKEAIRDYDKAIELDLQYAAAYNNRGNVKLALDKPQEAIKDYTEAKKLFEKAGDMKMAKECEEEIARLKKE